MTMKMASRLIDLISKKTNCTCSTLFLLISKKQICMCSTLFCLSLAVVFHDFNAVVYDSNVKCPSYTIFLWRCGQTVANSMYSHVITKFSQMDRLSHFLSYGAPQHRAWSSAMKSTLHQLWSHISLDFSQYWFLNPLP